MCDNLWKEKTWENTNVKQRLILLEPTMEEVKNIDPEDKRDKTWPTELQNIQQQLHNLPSYSFVEEKFNRVELYSWYYNIMKGQILLQLNSKRI